MLSTPAGADEGLLLEWYIIQELLYMTYLPRLDHFLRST